MEQRNWAGNYIYRAARWHRPHTVGEVQAVVRGARQVRAIGSRHTFHDLADTPGDLISLEHLDGIVALDHAQGTVTVQAGIRYGQLCEALHREGYALPNLASLPHISVAGACATATHGSGESLGSLATSVTALEYVTADGELVSLSRERDGERFAGAVVGLGGLGVVTSLTLALVPTFWMRQDVYEDLPLAQVENEFDAMVSSAYSVSFFADWGSPRFTQVWVKRRVNDGAENGEALPWFGATPATRPRHPADGPAQHCTAQMGVVGPWYERLPHFRMEYTPSSGDELQSEYILPRHHAIPAFRALMALGDQIAPLLHISEVRTIAADDLWLSPCYEQPSVAIHFTWHPQWPAVRALLPVIEAQLAPFHARPHWGKLFAMSPEQLRARYPRLPDFRQLLHAFDPEGKFRNDFLDTYLVGSR